MTIEPGSHPSRRVFLQTAAAMLATASGLYGQDRLIKLPSTPELDEHARLTLVQNPYTGGGRNSDLRLLAEDKKYGDRATILAKEMDLVPDRLLSEVPEARFMPARVEFYVYNNLYPQTTTAFRVWHDAGNRPTAIAVAMAFSTGELDLLTPAEAVGESKHEISHVVGLVNDGVAGSPKYHSQTAEAEAERQKRKLSPAEAQKHEGELLADNLRIRMTRDYPLFERSMLKHSRRQMELMSEGGLHLPRDAHPSADLRLREAKLLMKQLNAG